MNALENHSYPRDSFSKFIGISVIAHVAVVLFLTVKAAVFPSEPIQIRSAMRVDMVALPDKAPPKAAPAPKPAPKVEVKKPEPKPQPKPKVEPKPKPKAKPEEPKVNLNKAKKDQDDALNRLKAMQAIEQLKKQKQEEAETQAPPTQEFKGNALSEGNSLTGLAQIEFDRYFGDVESAIRQHWNLPKWLEDGNFRAQVRVLVDDRGYVINKRIETSSGNQAFDDVVLDTVELSSPLPPPPGRLKNVLSTRGFVLNFPE